MKNNRCDSIRRIRFAFRFPPYRRTWSEPGQTEICFETIRKKQTNNNKSITVANPPVTCSRTCRTCTRKLINLFFRRFAAERMQHYGARVRRRREHVSVRVCGLCRVGQRGLCGPVYVVRDNGPRRPAGLPCPLSGAAATGMHGRHAAGRLLPEVRRRAKHTVQVSLHLAETRALTDTRFPATVSL